MTTAAAKRALVLLAATVMGCSGAPAATPTPSGIGAPSASIVTQRPTATAVAPISTPSGSAGPSPSAMPEPTTAGPAATPVVTCPAGASTGPFAPDSIVCVTAGPLRVRSKPSTADDSLKFDPLLQTGQLLFVIDGPAEGSGYTWYLVQNTPGFVERADGWVAAGAKDGTPWLAAASVTCPAAPTLLDLAAMDLMQRLHCYHDREFTFTGVVEAGPNCGDGVVLKSPTWMAGCFSTFAWGERPTSLILAIPPDLADEAGSVEPDEPFQATVTAHMDDPAALTCVPNEGFEADYALLNPGVVLACRGMFVATSFARVTP